MYCTWKLSSAKDVVCLVSLASVPFICDFSKSNMSPPTEVKISGQKKQNHSIRGLESHQSAKRNGKEHMGRTTETQCLRGIHYSVHAHVFPDDRMTVWGEM